MSESKETKTIDALERNNFGCYTGIKLFPTKDSLVHYKRIKEFRTQ